MAMKIVQFVTAVLALLGLSELGLRLMLKKGFQELMGGRLVALGEEGTAERREMWMHHEKDGDGDAKHFHHQRFETMMKEKMLEVKTCHMGCGWDRACHEQCPKPWSHFQEKCEEVKPIIACHKGCGHDHACHMKCPMPKCPKMARKVQDAMQCHGTCGADRECHHACPHPGMLMGAKCEILGKVMACHKECRHGDHACHHACSKMRRMWKKGGHHDAQGVQDWQQWHAKRSSA